MLTVRKGKGDDADYYRQEQTRAAYYGKTGEVRASPELAQRLGIDTSRARVRHHHRIQQRQQVLLRARRPALRLIKGQPKRARPLPGFIMLLLARGPRATRTNRMSAKRR
jgi:hypothetical protein